MGRKLWRRRRSFHQDNTRYVVVVVPSRERYQYVYRENRVWKYVRFREMLWTRRHASITHVKQKHNNEKFTCSHCLQDFASKQSLKVHVASQHPEHAEPCHFKDNTEHHVCTSGYGACKRVPVNDNILKDIHGKDCCVMCYKHFLACRK